LLSYGPAVGQLEQRAKSAPPANRVEDAAAVQAAMQSFAKAFGARDAKALAAHWTALGEYHGENGKSVSGREALEGAFARFFAKSPEVKAEVRSESVRLLANDAAIEEGTVTVRRGAAESTSIAHYSAFFIREQGRWLLARLSETPAGADSVADLDWLIGEWKSGNGQGADIRSTYSWEANKRFIRVQFVVTEKAGAFSGSQVIGVDPSTGGIRTWTFEADGGVAVSDWIRDGDHWKLEVDGTLADGRRLHEVNILRRVNADTITWQSINRSLDGLAIPDLPPVKVTRVQSSK